MEQAQTPIFRYMQEAQEVASQFCTGP